MLNSPVLLADIVVYMSGRGVVTLGSTSGSADDAVNIARGTVVSLTVSGRVRALILAVFKRTTAVLNLLTAAFILLETGVVSLTAGRGWVVS